ncbi:hypothetical protein UMZ34_24780 [Halopseudomonas pachastrellae]|nr:hypothetical protein UMZ34_24780 [Halopseudomonas pachastrellae]
MPHSVDGRWLLALYLIIPLSLVAVLVDLLLFDRHWQQQWLPMTPTTGLCGRCCSGCRILLPAPLRWPSQPIFAISGVACCRHCWCSA